MTEQAFVAAEIKPEHVAAAHLVYRMSTLPKEALRDLLSLTEEVNACESADDYREVLQTVAELLFPETLIGEIIEGALAAKNATG